ncbi:protein FAM167A-like [Xyrauchen texanus]|uniref:protein FAM167A-like n=1 Tax=Xyrauchen texanus TaxID=154827 RepID=UPI0022427CA9|nr:protein FAM167A-like [Xyrauchen texanus]XP_052009326.1 protein FAM167A-like [Xyrauchen texanus]
MEFREFGADESSEETEHLDSVKALTEKLKLQTRRPSYLEWKERLQTRPWTDATHSSSVSSGSVEKDTNLSDILKDGMPYKNICGFDNIDDALEWLRRELREMQMQDNHLARQLIHLRGEIHRLKVEQVCHRHKEMLDNATFELEECEEDSDLLCDIPMKATFTLSTPLKHLGLTKMNLNSRRFSLC